MQASITATSLTEGYLLGLRHALEIITLCDKQQAKQEITNMMKEAK